MTLNVVPGWAKVLLALGGIALLSWSLMDVGPSLEEEAQILVAPGPADLESGFAGKVRNNVRQMVKNPLERPPMSGAGHIVIRDESNDYYRHEN